MLTPREKSPLPEAERRVELATLHHKPNTPPTELFCPPPGFFFFFFKLDLVIGTTELCSLVPVSMTLTLI